MTRMAKNLGVFAEMFLQCRLQVFSLIAAIRDPTFNEVAQSLQDVPRFLIRVVKELTCKLVEDLAALAGTPVF